MEATIFAKLRAISNVTITKVSPGSISVANSVAFTEADNDMAETNQGAFATLLGSPDGAVAVYGTTFGAVSVSNVTKATAPKENAMVLYANHFNTTFLGAAHSNMQQKSPWHLAVLANNNDC